MPRLLLIVVIICLHIPAFLQAQDNNKKTEFDSTYFYIATTLSAQNTEEAIVKARALLDHSTDSLQKIRSLMLLATLYERTGKHSDALLFAVKGEKLAAKTDNKEWQIRISGFLSTAFRDIGLIAEGKKYIEVAEKANDSTGGSPIIQMFIHQEKAYYDIAEQKYDKALIQINHAINLLEKAPPGKSNNIFKATCYQLAGLCYMKLNDLTKAAGHFKTSLSLLEGQESELKGFIYQNMGELALKQKNYNEALTNLEQALGYTNSSGNTNLKLETYKSLKEYYLAQSDSINAMKFQSQYLEVLEKQSDLTKNAYNRLIEKSDNELKKTTSINYYLYLVCVILVILVIGYIVYSTRSRKKERVQYLDYITKLNRQRSALLRAGTARDSVSISVSPAGHLLTPAAEGPVAENNETETGEEVPVEAGSLPADIPPTPENEKRDTLYIPKDTEERILGNLLKLEEERFFLKNEVTLSYLSTALKTNSKYLSLIINKHKGKDFNNYINELRINYIIDTLQRNPGYLEYKISYLALECGFSTHSKFTAAFKNITGISPSAFINNLKKDNT